MLYCIVMHFLPQGILLEHREREFGDKANMLAVIRTARKMQDIKIDLKM